MADISGLAGRFIVFDGPDGSGKTTQFNRFLALCQSEGTPVCEVREPGGTSIGERIRDILLDNDHAEMSLRCEMMLYMASRSQLVEERIRPALGQGKLVLADRFISSTLAYQGAAGGLPLDEILAVARVACRDAWPDLVVIFDVDEETAARRMGNAHDRMEAKGREYHRKVRAGYLEQASSEPERHLVLDASRPEDEVARELVEALASRRWPASPARRVAAE